MRSSLWFALLAVGACDYTAPLDPEADAVLNSVHGTVTFAGPERPDAPVFVILYDAMDPPPPSGTGGPVTFAAVDSSAFTGDGAGMQSAPFAITRVPDGQYLVQALMDVDGDFRPSPPILGGGTCGDWAGAHVTELVDPQVAPVTLAGGTLTDDVLVVLSAQYPLERPAFRIGDNTLDRADPSDWNFTVEATDIRTSATELDGPFAGDPTTLLGSCETTFLVHVVDADGDGNPDPHWLFEGGPAPDGAYAIWPRIYIQYVPEDTDTGEAELLPGESYAAEVFVFPDFLLTGEVPVGIPVPRNTLTAQFAGQVLHTLPDGTEEFVSGADIPDGAWAVTLVAETGQTWTVPNALAAPDLFGERVTDESWLPETQASVVLMQ